MKFVKKNRGVIVFYLLLAITTLVVINCNEQNLSLEKEYVYLTR